MPSRYGMLHAACCDTLWHTILCAIGSVPRCHMIGKTPRPAEVTVIAQQPGTMDGKPNAAEPTVRQHMAINESYRIGAITRSYRMGPSSK